MAETGCYNICKTNLLSGAVNCANAGDSFKICLLNNSHVFTATHTTYANISANEITGTGYTAGGRAMAGQSVAGTTTVTWDCTDPAWTTATFTAYKAAVYDTTVSDDLMCSFDLGGAQTVAAGTFTLVFTSGLITLAG